ncbi:MAG TPA: ABC transporter permease [Opitutus sp.]|nr:ABC transporter permease [Opitutus sp.]
MHDLRYALRQLAKSPGFTAVAVLTLALGIGACTAIFSVVNSVLLRPLPFPDSDRLVVVIETKLPEVPQFSVAPGNYFDWREHATSFEQLAAIRDASYSLTGSGEPVRLEARRVTPNYFSMLRVHPAIGRDFTAAEATAKSNVAILNHGFWLRQFGGRRDVIGETVQLDGQAFTIIGVLPEHYSPGSTTEIYTPVDYAEDNKNHGGHYVSVIGRLKPGVSVEQARGELALIADGLARQYPSTNTGWSIKLTPLLEATVGDVRPVLFSLLGAVGFLLLIACANVANLLLVRATARAKEIALRTALGASRLRIVRQLLTESVLLALVGGGFGVLIAQWGMSVLLAFAPDTLPRAQEIALDGRALGFACVLALVTGIAFGLVPAFQASRINLNETLKDGGRGTSEGGRRQRLRSTLVVAEVAIALVLLIGAGLLFRSFARLQHVDPGFHPEGALAIDLTLPQKKYGTDPQRAAFVAQATAALAAIPGVQSAGASQIVPFTGNDYNLLYKIPGRPPLPPGTIQGTLYYAATPDYFKAMGIPLLRGRFFTAADAAGAPRVAIINEALAKLQFPNQDPIGQHINITNADAEIVGLVGDVKHYQLDGGARVQAYEPFAQVPFNFMTLVVRVGDSTPGALSNAALPAAIRTAIYGVDKDQPIASIRPLASLVAESVARPRFAMFLFGVFSTVALLLSAIGIYGVMAYSVTQRTNEIGIRMALGAQRRDVLRLVLAQGGRLVGLGVIAGLLGALLLTRFISSMLFGVTARDPVTFAVIATLLATIAAVACLLPALRATRVDPVEALRAE